MIGAGAVVTHDVPDYAIVVGSPAKVIGDVRGTTNGGGSVINVGVIGYGYWGPNLVRNFQELPGCRVVMVSDLNGDRCALVQRRHPDLKVTQDYQHLIQNSEIDAIVIATPVATHFPLAMAALKSGKHVFVEKPLAASSEQVLQLMEEADRRKLTIMVDHTFVYTGAVQKIRSLIQNGELGSIYYYDAVRVNLGLFQHDVNVLWDLAVHDLSIMDFVLPSKPIGVSATGISHVPGGPENIAYLTVFFPERLIAHVHVNWLAPTKVRRTLIGGTQKMIVYDDIEPSEKIKVYDKGITIDSDDEEVYQTLVGYRTGDMWAPQIDLTEALKTEAQHFVSCLEDGKQPITDGGAGLRLVQVLEAASESLARQGQMVEFAEIGVLA